MIQRSDFSIEDDVADGQPGYRANQIWEAKAKIIPAFRIETDDAIASVELAAPAIELDLMKPGEPVRRLVPLGWDAGFDEGEATQHATYVYKVFEAARAPQERLGACAYTCNAVKTAQRRHGLPATGFLDHDTILELNVPAVARLRQLRINLPRLQTSSAAVPAGKYVAANIPSVQIEAVNNNQVVSRHTGVVGKPDRPSPLVNSAIEEINFNKDWFVPPTVLKSDLLGEAHKKGKDALLAHKIDVYTDFAGYQKGQHIDPDTIDWNSDAPLHLFYVQNGGHENPLGFVKLNFASPHHVYMHDTAAPSIFSKAFRAESSGCVRVQGIHRLVAWLLEDNGWTVQQVMRMKDTGEKLNIRLKKKVPLFWVYITGWATQDGTVQFRRDIYRRDDSQVASAY